MARSVSLLLIVGAALAAAPAFALDYRSVTEPAVLWDGPSAKAKKQFIIARGTPVELVLERGAWSKVRDAKGSLAWIETKMLSAKRTVMVKADRAQIRAQADDKSALVFEAEKDVVLEWVEAGPAGWAKVKHRDGQVGFVRIGQVWGL